MNEKKLVEHRCSNCNALLFKAKIQEGHVEIKCRCGTMNNVISKKPEGHRAPALRASAFR